MILQHLKVTLKRQNLLEAFTKKLLRVCLNKHFCFFAWVIFILKINNEAKNKRLVSLMACSSFLSAPYLKQLRKPGNFGFFIKRGALFFVCMVLAFKAVQAAIAEIWPYRIFFFLDVFSLHKDPQLN